MPKFSKRSLEKLSQCAPGLYNVFMRVIDHFDCIVLCGFRNEEDQNLAYEKGHSKLKWPDSMHNKQPSLAVDVAPFILDWEDRERMTYFAGVVMGIAIGLGVKLKWGGDWDSDTEVKDNTFDDLVHFELEEVCN